VAAVTDLDHLFAHVVELIKNSFGFDHVHIFTVEGDKAVFRASTSPMNGPWRERGLSLPLDGPGLVAWVARKGQPVVVSDVRKEPRYIGDPDGVLAGTLSEIAVPMKVEDRVLGVLDAQSGRVGAFTRDDLFVLQTVADAVAIAIEDANLYREALAARRLEEELRVARQIQTSLLPDSPPEVPGWDIAADWRPAQQVAGDFYDFVSRPDGRLGIIIADVSDKGVPAALYMAMARSLIRAMVLGDRPPAQALSRASQLILADSRADMFVTLFYTLLDPITGQVTYVNAGHNPPLYFCAGLGSVAQFRADGVALGAVEHITLNAWDLTLRPGDLILMYTDGVTEAFNQHYEPFGMERLINLVLAHHDLSAQELIARINQAVAEFVGDKEPFDDAALVVLKRLPA
jgi:sigma-B regulation protein RsbU (phosphoserine phosphatase)